jgi:sortase A
MNKKYIKDVLQGANNDLVSNNEQFIFDWTGITKTIILTGRRYEFLKHLTILLILAGVLFIAIASYQYTNTEVSKKNSLIEAHQIIKSHTSKKINNTFTEEQPSIGDVIGILKFPSINEEVPIIEGTDEDSLEKGVGHFKGSSYPNEKGQIVLSGHRDTVFRRTGELNLGDLLTISLPYGYFTYKIVDTQIVDSNDRTIITLQKEEEILTLTTCYPFSFVGNAPQRYIITAKPVENQNKKSHYSKRMWDFR